MASRVTFSLAFLACVAGSLGQVSCPPEGVSYLPLPDCTKYIVCDNGHPFEMECPPSLYYSTAIEECDFPENVPECVGGTREPISGSTTTPIPSTDTPTDEPTTTTTEGTTTTGTPPTTSPPSPVTLKECGDTGAGNRGRIEYKVGAPYDNNELCGFIIEVPDYSGILFTLSSHGLNNTERNPINIFTFTNNGLLETAHLGPPNPLSQVYVSGSLAVVVFQTQQRSGYGATGFELSFEGMSGDGVANSGDQRVFSVAQDGAGELVVPTQGADAARGTLNAYVMSQNHKAVTPSYYTLDLKITNADLMQCGDVMMCPCDSIRVFQFLSERVDEMSLFCDERYHRSTFITKGLYIVVVNVFPEAYPRNATLSWKSQGL